ncbi:hypothetical protein BB14905_13470 [Bacillus sp. B14905]|nr:hypothetical protein BB14905_13470 [Bacillus sp. B14905]
MVINFRWVIKMDAQLTFMMRMLIARCSICAYKIEESRGIGFNKNKSIEKLRQD